MYTGVTTTRETLCVCVCVWYIATHQKYCKSVVCSVYFQLQSTSTVQNEIVLAALNERLVTIETVTSSLRPGGSPAFPKGKEYQYL